MGGVGGWHGGMVGMVTGGMLGSGTVHHVEGDLGIDASASRGSQEDDTETSQTDGGNEDDMDEDLADDWLPQDDDPMGLRPPDVRDEVWLAPNGLASTANKGSLRTRSRQPSLTSVATLPLAASQGALATISGLARPMLESEPATVSIPMVDLQVSLYDLSLYFLEDDGASSSATAKIMRTRCRAWSSTEVMSLMQEVGFLHVNRAPDNAFSQPLFYGYKPSA
ncbi:hypothetical protein HDU67_001669 [Dinochytrium kinnereticum]|nr:hypothetical protein HDU67_001669 [Dinochytrium kinnereticum]